MEQKIFLGGFGGQGVVYGGKLLGSAIAAVGKSATAYSEYAPAMRNAYTYTTLIVADDTVGSPVTETFDFMVFFDEESCATQSGNLKSNGRYLVNTSLVTSRPAVSDAEVYGLAANDVAEKLGDPRYLNIIMLGALIKLTGIIKMEDMEAELTRSFGKKPEVVEGNKKALRAGADMVAKI